ncbi:hypothetical protein CY34DRAFT_803929 [Suillus luteus UH-Slu-Lm8-n1]|uniref:Pyridoxamine 5'-phosphate oxidase putative domain-containing protein n=1 Tax=Suillus luteus UH-Slu-Lm8-n1 TaxID=930992 RepID=A0A0D0B007_9AGAM|nr:hypothetical protein CY34DRAFT_803929 [Suillus luteus UH-Slu-Lm8-n1]
MAKYYDEIPLKLIEWILKQQMFWVATAALQGDGHVNVSPKGTAGCFHVESPTRVWYEDLTGSGIETIAHMRQPGNGRITILFNAFEGPPRILRLWGKGTVYEFGTPEYNDFIPVSNRKAGSRAIIVIDVHKVGTSCGFGVPLYKYETQRTILERWCDSMENFDREGEPRAAPPPYETESSALVKDPRGIKAWWTVENLESFDGLPAMRSAHDSQIAPVNTFDKKAPHPSLGQIRAAAEKKEKEKEQEKAKAGLRTGEGMRLVVAFGVGVMVTMGYVRFVTSRVPVSW